MSDDISLTEAERNAGIVRCDACPVLCRIRPGRAGACDRYANADGALVRVDPAYFRPPEVDLLIGNPAKAREKLGWTHTVGLKALVQDMITHDLAEARGQPIPPSPVLAALAAEGAPHDG